MTGFETRFGMQPSITVFTPGRVNLLGEHVDYSGGMVLPMAVPLGVTLSMASNSRTPIEDRVAAAEFDGEVRKSMDAARADHWSDYVIGALQTARAQGWIGRGQCVYTSSNLPHGAGLSSSAAVIVSLLKACAPKTTPAKDIAVLARKVENDFIGVPCGIMDQMAVAISTPGEVLALDTLSLEYEALPLPRGLKVGVIHSGIRRSLVEGRYAKRRQEILDAAHALGVDWLCDADVRDAEKLSEPLRRRARHVISEDRRTRDAAKALRAGDINRFAGLVNEGHASIRDDFEITTSEVDAIVDSACAFGAIAARQTGGGFGGCIVVLFNGEAPSNWFDLLNARHPNVWQVVSAA